ARGGSPAHGRGLESRSREPPRHERRTLPGEAASPGPSGACADLQGSCDRGDASSPGVARDSCHASSEKPQPPSVAAPPVEVGGQGRRGRGPRPADDALDRPAALAQLADRLAVSEVGATSRLPKRASVAQVADYWW